MLLTGNNRPGPRPPGLVHDCRPAYGRQVPRAWRSTMARRILVVLVLAMAAVLPSGTPAQAADRPTKMAALGDSITRGFNACGWYVDCPSRSWSTGSYSTVNSH